MRLAIALRMRDGFGHDPITRGDSVMAEGGAPARASEAWGSRPLRKRKRPGHRVSIRRAGTGVFVLVVSPDPDH
jgi:hypothetical protein